jgi:DNA-binding response OmpR family regulator
MGIRKVVLLAEDEPMVRNLIGTILSSEDYRVLMAFDGREAVEFARNYKGPIHLLLTDVSMPHVDGISAYQQIKADRAGIKVLFISDQLPGALTMPAGVPFLSKPFSADALRTRMRELLQDCSTQAEGEVAQTAAPVDRNDQRPDAQMPLFAKGG